MKLVLWKLVHHEVGVIEEDTVAEDAENTKLNLDKKSPVRVVFCFTSPRLLLHPPLSIIKLWRGEGLPTGRQGGGVFAEVCFFCYISYSVFMYIERVVQW